MVRRLTAAATFLIVRWPRATAQHKGASAGVSGCGAVFKLTPPTVSRGAWTETILHSLTGQNGEAPVPLTGLTQTSTGTLYGTTSTGGTAGAGTVFSITP